MKYLDPDINKVKLSNIRAKYRDLPDNYYGGDFSKYLSPDNYPGLYTCEDQYVDPGDKTVKRWEWYSGSAALSAYLEEFQISHFPPVDYRYDWNLSEHEHQQRLLDIQINVGVDIIFAAPNCSPWGNNSGATPKELRDQRRAEETFTLQFLAVACFFRS